MNFLVHRLLDFLFMVIWEKCESVRSNGCDPHDHKRVKDPVSIHLFTHFGELHTFAKLRSIFHPTNDWLGLNELGYS